MMSNIEIKRRNFWSLDIAKFLCSILIISAHFASEWGNFPVVIDYAFSLYIIAVPFFFCCSGFLFFNKWLFLDAENRKKYFLKYQKRIWIMYGLWSAIYLLPKWLFDFFKYGRFMSIEDFTHWLHTAVVYTTYPTIWFLPALAVGIAISCFLVSKLSKKNIVLISVTLYIIGMLGYTYSFLFESTFLESIINLYLDVFELLATVYLTVFHLLLWECFLLIMIVKPQSLKNL